jgi:hypothetical protein
VLEIIRIGDARPNGKASKFRYLLSQTANGEAVTDSMISANAYAKEQKPGLKGRKEVREAEF